MSDYSRFQLPWDDEAFASFGRRAQVTSHDYHKLPLFSKASLIDFLDRYPRELLRCYVMGDDPGKPEEWGLVDIGPDLKGADIWRAVEKGRLWINVLEVETHSEVIGELIKQMYRQLDQRCAHLQSPRPAMSNLIVSSPGAMVYYHLDAEPNMLWHLLGEKRIWIYPAMDLRFVSLAQLENIYAGTAGENLPYRPEFDDHATSYRLQPGQVASWPHNAPHRIVNTDLNVSLATSFYTTSIYKRQYLQLANKYVVRRLGIRNPSLNEDGVVAECKRLSYRAINKIRPFKRKNRPRRTYSTRLSMDPGAEAGVMQLNAPVKPHFVKAKEAAR